MRRLAIVLALVSCVPVGEEEPNYPTQPRQDEAVGLILDAYELGRPRMAIEWAGPWQDCGWPTFRHGRECVTCAVDDGPVFRMRPPIKARYSETPLPMAMCRHFLGSCPLNVTDRAMNALFHAGL
jgi:hypothetical protein